MASSARPADVAPAAPLRRTSLSPLPPGNATVGASGIRIRECQLKQAAALFFELAQAKKPGGAMDVLGWLRELGLEQYEAIFRDNDIDPSILLSLTNEDPKTSGSRRSATAASCSML